MFLKTEVKIHRKTPVLQSFFQINLQAGGLNRAPLYDYFCVHLDDPSIKGIFDMPAITVDFI